MLAEGNATSPFSPPGPPTGLPPAFPAFFRRFWHASLAIILTLFSLASPAAAPPTSAPNAIRSRSGQFLVIQPTRPLLQPNSKTGPTNGLLNLSPEYTAVSCERIKDGLLRELGLKDVFRENTGPRKAQITIEVTPPSSSLPDLHFAATRYTDGWDYRLQVPAQVPPDLFVRGVVHALLVAWANRFPGTHAAEIPIWLTEGMARRVEGNSPVELVLDRPHGRVNGLPMDIKTRLNRRGELSQPSAKDNLEPVRERLRTHPALTFTELSLPSSAMEPESMELYRDCAQLFVDELLQSPRGRENLRRFLERLTQHLNWQTAFYQSFQPQFARPIDVEKWWALTLVAFTGRDPAQVWAREVAWRRLEQVLTLQGNIRTDDREIPARRLSSLQEVVQEWDTLQQGMVLHRVIRQLGSIQLKLPVDLAQLAENYRIVLTGFLSERNRQSYGSGKKGEVPLTTVMLAKQVVRKLDELDQRRRDAMTAPPAEAPASRR